MSVNLVQRNRSDLKTSKDSGKQPSDTGNQPIVHYISMQNWMIRLIKRKLLCLTVDRPIGNGEITWIADVADTTIPIQRVYPNNRVHNYNRSCKFNLFCRKITDNCSGLRPGEHGYQLLIGNRIIHATRN